MSTTEEVTVTESGAVTIPRTVRERLGIKEGDAISITVEEDGTATVRKARDPMGQLRDVREQLAPLEVDVEQLQREAERAWSTFE